MNQYPREEEMAEIYTELEIQKAKDLLIDAGYFGDLNFHKEDVIAKLEEKGVSASEIGDVVLDEICEQAHNTIKNNEGIWEGYWLSIDYAIHDILANNNIEVDEELN